MYDVKGRGAIDAIAGPRLSGAILGGEVPRGQLDAARSRDCLVVPSVRQLRHDAQRGAFAAGELGVSDRLVCLLAKELEGRPVMLKVDETDLDARLEVDEKGRWHGDIDYAGLELDRASLRSVQQQRQLLLADCARVAEAHAEPPRAAGSVSADSPAASRDVRSSKAVDGKRSESKRVLADPSDSDVEMEPAAPLESASDEQATRAAEPRLPAISPSRFSLLRLHAFVALSGVALGDRVTRTQAQVEQRTKKFEKKERDLRKASRDEVAVQRFLKHKERTLADLQWTIADCSALLDRRVRSPVCRSKVDRLRSGTRLDYSSS